MTSREEMTVRPEVAWSALASKWDTSGAAWNQPVADRLIELAGLTPGMLVADMGCGTGAVTLPAARVVRPGRVTGIDSAASMIGEARRRAEKSGTENVMFWCEDATHPTLEPREFDAVLSSMVVSYLPDPGEALRAWRELLKPGGVLAFSWVLSDDKEWNAVYDAVDAFLMPDKRWADHTKRRTIAEAEALLPPGLRTSTTVEAVTTRYESPQHWWESSWTQAPAIAWGQIPEAMRDSAREAAFSVLRGLQHRDSSLERTRAVGYSIAR